MMTSVTRESKAMIEAVSIFYNYFISFIIHQNVIFIRFCKKKTFDFDLSRSPWPSAPNGKQRNSSCFSYCTLPNKIVTHKEVLFHTVFFCIPLVVHYESSCLYKKESAFPRAAVVASTLPNADGPVVHIFSNHSGSQLPNI